MEHSEWPGGGVGCHSAAAAGAENGLLLSADAGGVALALSRGGIEPEDLPNGNTLPALDSTYITALATQFQSRLEERATLAK